MDVGSYIPLFKKFNSYILTTHLNPDGDGLGSQLALREYLLSTGKKVRCINHSPTPRHYSFLDPSDEIFELYREKEHDVPIKDADCIVVLDTNVPSRLGNMENIVRQSRAVKIVVDHHLDRDQFADHYLVDESATATGEIIFKLLGEATNNNLNDRIAEALYTAIMTDTGSFRFPKTNRDTHLITAELLKYNVDPSMIYREVYERGPVNRLVLLGYALSSLQLFHDGRVAMMRISKDMFEDTDTNVVETDGFVNYTMQIDTVVIGVLFTETDENVKISFRARGEIFVNRLAKEFGGNGHQHAAGATIPGGDLDMLMKDVTNSSKKYLP